MTIGERIKFRRALSGSKYIEPSGTGRIIPDTKTSPEGISPEAFLFAPDMSVGAQISLSWPCFFKYALFAVTNAETLFPISPTDF